MSKLIPRYLALFTDLIIPKGQLTFIPGEGMFCLGEIKRAFDLFVFSESLFAVIQLHIAHNSDFSLFCSSSGVAALTRRHVSSANNRGTEEIEFEISFTYNRKSNGPSEEP